MCRPDQRSRTAGQACGVAERYTSESVDLAEEKQVNKRVTAVLLFLRHV